jgi:large subunit ribosomal protein L31
MRKGIHPNFYTDAVVTCACGNTWTTGSTRKVIHTELCSKCHPFYTGEQQRIVDTEGQVDRFFRKLQARQTFVEQQKAREDSRTSLERPVAELGLGNRPTESLTKGGFNTVGQILTALEKGEAGLLAVDGFGRKSLIDLKKALRAQGYSIPAAADEIAV